MFVKVSAGILQSGEGSPPVRALLAANIKAGRRNLGFSQEKLAELTGLSTQTISDIEGCRTWVSDKTLFRLSEILNVAVFQLLTPVDDDEKIRNFFSQSRYANCART